MSPNWGRSVTVQVSTVGDVGPESDRSLAKRRALYAVSTTVVTLVMVLGVVDAFGWFNVFGVDSARVEASAGGYRLDVQYTAVSRPALASPFEITVSREGGFDGPVTIGVTRTYLQIWDENGLFPAPSAETVNGEWLEWEFDPPVGDELIVLLRRAHRAGPAVGSRRRRGRRSRTTSPSSRSTSTRRCVPDGDHRSGHGHVRRAAAADALPEAPIARRDGAVRAVAARDDRRHRAAGHHPGGLLAHWLGRWR